jgi:FKBP-type peptidyl-prolyl cis-trans isomerase FkpA
MLYIVNSDRRLTGGEADLVALALRHWEIELHEVSDTSIPRHRFPQSARGLRCLPVELMNLCQRVHAAANTTSSAAQLRHRIRYSIFNLRKGRLMNKLVITTAALFVVLTFQAHAADSKEEKTASGIGITTLKEGTGANPKVSDTVKVHYRGTLENGQEFDSSYKRGQPATFPLTRVIPCWTEGVQKIKVGGKARLVCPPNLAYGNQNVPGIPPGSTLIFEVELLDIAK